MSSCLGIQLTCGKPERQQSTAERVGQQKTGYSHIPLPGEYGKSTVGIIQKMMSSGYHPLDLQFHDKMSKIVFWLWRNLYKGKK